MTNSCCRAHNKITYNSHTVSWLELCDKTAEIKTCFFFSEQCCVINNLNSNIFTRSNWCALKHRTIRVINLNTHQYCFQHLFNRPPFPQLIHVRPLVLVIKVHCCGHTLILHWKWNSQQCFLTKKTIFVKFKLNYMYFITKLNIF